MITVEAIPILRDNYVWAIHDGHRAALVDPGEAAPILSWLDARGMHPIAILVTHHHHDHIGGIADLLTRYPIPVHGPTRNAMASQSVHEGERLRLPGLDFELSVLETPGHTLDHVCYLGQGHLFCGDTLFSCGCGRLFEGSPQQMYASLSRLAGLPGDTLVHCAHEYTLANIAFAQEIEPDNITLRTRHAEALRLRKQGLPTLPIDLARERETNPFLRCDLESLAVAVTQHTASPTKPGAETFTRLRAWKDAF